MSAIGIIGGSGLDDPDILKDTKTLDVDTPFGKPSAPLSTGRIRGADVVLLPRHRLAVARVDHVVGSAGLGPLAADVVTGILEGREVVGSRGEGHFPSLGASDPCGTTFMAAMYATSPMKNPTNQACW